jgi:hypothetical protein
MARGGRSSKVKGEAEGVRKGVGLPDLRMVNVYEGIGLDRSATSTNMRDSSTVNKSWNTSLIARPRSSQQRSRLMKTQETSVVPNEIRTFLYTVDSYTYNIIFWHMTFDRSFKRIFPGTIMLKGFHHKIQLVTRITAGERNTEWRMKRKQCTNIRRVSFGSENWKTSLWS